MNAAPHCQQAGGARTALLPAPSSARDDMPPDSRDGVATGMRCVRCATAGGTPLIAILHLHPPGVRVRLLAPRTPIPRISTLLLLSTATVAPSRTTRRISSAQAKRKSNFPSCATLSCNTTPACASLLV